MMVKIKSYVKNPQDNWVLCVISCSQKPNFCYKMVDSEQLGAWLLTMRTEFDNLKVEVY